MDKNYQPLEAGKIDKININLNKRYRRTSSFERNGFFNIHTPVLNTKMIPWVFGVTLLWGWMAF